MGRPKQLMAYQGRTLLDNVVEAALNSCCNHVVAVLGSDFELVKKSISNPEVEIVENVHWQKGMSASIVCGIDYLNTAYDSIEAVVVCVCDQPFITSAIIDGLVAEYARKKNPIIASRYAGIYGVPALFSADLFPELLSLSGNRGASGIIKAHMDEVAAVDFPQGQMDIDTGEDWDKLLKEGRRLSSELHRK